MVPFGSVEVRCAAWAVGFLTQLVLMLAVVACDRPFLGSLGAPGTPDGKTPSSAGDATAPGDAALRDSAAQSPVDSGQQEPPDPDSGIKLPDGSTPSGEENEAGIEPVADAGDAAGDGPSILTVGSTSCHTEDLTFEASDSKPWRGTELDRPLVRDVSLMNDLLGVLDVAVAASDDRALSRWTVENTTQWTPWLFNIEIPAVRRISSFNHVLGHMETLHIDVKGDVYSTRQLPRGNRYEWVAGLSGVTDIAASYDLNGAPRLFAAIRGEVAELTVNGPNPLGHPEFLRDLGGGEVVDVAAGRFDRTRQMVALRTHNGKVSVRGASASVPDEQPSPWFVLEPPRGIEAFADIAAVTTYHGQLLLWLLDSAGTLWSRHLVHFDSRGPAWGQWFEWRDSACDAIRGSSLHMARISAKKRTDGSVSLLGSTVQGSSHLARMEGEAWSGWQVFD